MWENGASGAHPYVAAVPSGAARIVEPPIPTFVDRSDLATLYTSIAIQPNPQNSKELNYIFSGNKTKAGCLDSRRRAGQG
jgi:hypothetical protein